MTDRREVAAHRRAWNIRRRVYRWAGRNDYRKHVSRAEERWLLAHDRRCISARVARGTASNAEHQWWKQFGVRA